MINFCGRSFKFDQQIFVFTQATFGKFMAMNKRRIWSIKNCYNLFEFKNIQFVFRLHVFFFLFFGETFAYISDSCFYPFEHDNIWDNLIMDMTYIMSSSEMYFLLWPKSIFKQRRQGRYSGLSLNLQIIPAWDYLPLGYAWKMVISSFRIMKTFRVEKGCFFCL